MVKRAESADWEGLPRPEVGFLGIYQRVPWSVYEVKKHHGLRLVS